MYINLQVYRIDGGWERCDKAMFYYIESEIIHILKVLFNFLNVFEETAI